MGVVAKIITALAAILPAIVEWWAKRRAAQEQAAAADRVADVRADPGSAWLRKFGAADKQHGDDKPADQAGPDQPGDNERGRDNDG